MDGGGADTVHPPMFSRVHTLSDWPDCWLEVRCLNCSQMTMVPVQLLRERHGDRHSFKAVVAALRCKSCGSRPAPVFLVAGHDHKGGGSREPDWAIKLVLAPG